MAKRKTSLRNLFSAISFPSINSTTRHRNGETSLLTIKGRKDNQKNEFHPAIFDPHMGRIRSVLGKEMVKCLK